MDKYDIFKSEGGFRICLATWLSQPIMNYAPWFETEEEAKADLRQRLVNDISCEIERLSYMQEDLRPYHEKNIKFLSQKLNALEEETK